MNSPMNAARMARLYAAQVGNVQDTPSFRSKGYVQGWSLQDGGDGTAMMAGLPAILRTLLVTDGTVTKCLESYFWEPIHLEQVQQQVQMLAQPVAWLEVSAGVEVLTRSVQLVGAQSRRCYAEAFSVIRLDLLPAEVRQALLDGSIGIGELLRDREIETYRELLDIGPINTLNIKSSSIGTATTPTTPEIVSRAYRIWLAHQPALLVTEYFPVASFR